MSMMIMTMMTMGNDSDYYNSGERYSDYDDEDEGDYDDEDEGDCDGDCDGDDAVDDDAAFLSESQKCTIQAAQQFTLRSPATGLGVKAEGQARHRTPTGHLEVSSSDSPSGCPPRG